MPRDEHHVVPGKNGGWDVKRNGGERASAHTETKKDAVNIARTISQNQRRSLLSTIGMAKSQILIATAMTRVLPETRNNSTGSEALLRPAIPAFIQRGDNRVKNDIRTEKIHTLIIV